MPETREQVLELEAEIEELSRAAEKCRKIDLVAKAMAFAGAFLLAVVFFGLLRRDAWMLPAAISAVLGGGVLYASNRSTLQQVTSAIKRREAQRVEIVEGLELRLVERRSDATTK